MNLRTRYLGLDLDNPFIPGASPLCDSLDTVKRLEDAGAPALVLRSLFEEQLVAEELATHKAMETPAESFAEALSYFPDPEGFKLGPESYLEHIRKVKAAVKVPVIASLNGVNPGAWLGHSKLIQEAGADALELNVYYMPTDGKANGAEIEKRTVDMVRSVKSALRIPVAVKLSPFYTATASFVQELSKAGADGVVLFNRFYQPDIDIDALEVKRELVLSDNSILLLRLRWIAIMYGNVPVSLGLSGGVHSAADAIKACMVGSDSVQLVSCLLKRGPQYLKTLIGDVSTWMESHEYESLTQMKGSMSMQKSGNPAAFERANYMQILLSW